MELAWKRDPNPRWDADKQRLFAQLPGPLFADLRSLPAGSPVPADWWRVERGGQPVGYGWMDVTWGDAEMLVAVEPSAQRHGVGTFIIDRLDEEAARQGLRYLYNVVPAEHPSAAAVQSWLERRGFIASGEGALLRRQVRARG
jgi:GNAT superfamily N-acetyltransferase